MLEAIPRAASILFLVTSIGAAPHAMARPDGSMQRLTLLVFALLLPALGSRSSDVSDVALEFLRRHGVPCLSVTQVTAGEEMIVRCHDGREWVLFFIEGEVGFVQPATREPYRWQREVYILHPDVYGTTQRHNGTGTPAGLDP